MGVGDQVPAALEQLGASVRMLTRRDLAYGDLSRFDAIVTGVRAYERRARPPRGQPPAARVRRGRRHVLVQYNKFEFNQAQYGPFPAKVSAEPRDRRARARDGAAARAPGVHATQPDHRRTRGADGCRSAACISWASGIRGTRISWSSRIRSSSTRARSAARCRRAGRQRTLGVRGPEPVAAAAGRHRRRLPAAGEPRVARARRRERRRPRAVSPWLQVPDVLVVGGGPAGATAARTLALRAARVRLLDRARFPRNKPCGGACQHARAAAVSLPSRCSCRASPRGGCPACISKPRPVTGLRSRPRARGPDGASPRVRRAAAGRSRARRVQRSSRASRCRAHAKRSDGVR